MRIKFLLGIKLLQDVNNLLVLYLKKLAKGNVVGFIASNTPELYEAHFGVPMAGMILNAINYRLDAKTIAYIIDHSDIKMLFLDTEFLKLGEESSQFI